MIGWLLLAAGGVGFNQTFIQGLAECGPFEQALFRILPETLVVFPTENYYYFHLGHCGEEFRGNLNFSLFYPEPEVRVVFYTTANLSLQGETFSPRDSTVVKTFTRKNGLRFEKLGENLYRVRIPVFPKPLLVRFVPIPQSPPPLPDTSRFEFIFRTMDESGLLFVLTYDRKEQDFVWFLSDTQFVPVPLRQVGDDPIFVHERSGFVFVKTGPALMLVGVPELNRVQNNWYDGPFDQLNDRQWNPRLSSIFKEFAASVKKRVDARGYMRNGNRLALGHYVHFVVFDDFLVALDQCLKPEKTLPYCISRSYNALVSERNGSGEGSPQKP